VHSNLLICEGVTTPQSEENQEFVSRKVQQLCAQTTPKRCRQTGEECRL